MKQQLLNNMLVKSLHSVMLTLLFALFFVGCYDDNSIVNRVDNSDIYPIVGEWVDTTLEGDDFDVIRFRLDDSFYGYYTDDDGVSMFESGAYSYDESDESIVYIDVVNRGNGEKILYRAKYQVDDRGDSMTSNNILYMWNIEEDEVIDDRVFTLDLADKVYKRRR